MNNLNQILQNELDYLTGRVKWARDQADAYADYLGGDTVPILREAEKSLGDADWELQQASPDPDKARAALTSAQEGLAALDGKLRRAVKAFENRMALWSLFVLLLAAVGAYLVYSNRAPPAFYYPPGGRQYDPQTHQRLCLLPPDTWPPVRFVLLAAFGGMAGAGIVLSRILSHFGPSRDLNPRRKQWNYISPFVCAALASVFILVIRMTPALAFAGGTPGHTGRIGTSGVAFALGLGVLVGFAPDSIIFRIKAVIKALFGTSEVSPPQVSKPQVVRKSDTVIGVTVSITPSDTTSITSANAILQIPTGEASSVLTREQGNLYTADITLPQSRDPSTGGSNGSLVIEAWDDTGNVARSSPVTLPPINQTAGDKGANGSGANEPPPKSPGEH